MNELKNFSFKATCSISAVKFQTVSTGRTSLCSVPTQFYIVHLHLEAKQFVGRRLLENGGNTMREYS